ncbi:MULTISPECIES: hypothetical protein [unclassified Psychrobacillus]|uniref:hypothetical protein n=1 Tax=unclassified Psychrobacillus TaxID=2636677 RepID=UPI0030FB6F2A
MNQYNIALDLSETWEERDIQVETVVVEAENAPAASELVAVNIQNGEYDELIAGREVYIWDVTEDDKVETEG